MNEAMDRLREAVKAWHGRTSFTGSVGYISGLGQNALHARFGGKHADKLREEAVHTAAVALAIVECIDRGKWAWPGEVKP